MNLARLALVDHLDRDEPNRMSGRRDFEDQL